MSPLSPQALKPLILAALREDAAWHDATSRAVIAPKQCIKARIIARTPGIAAGIKVAAMAFTLLDSSLRVRPHVRSGAKVSAGSRILTIEGRAQSIFAAERVALNFLGHLSGIATLTHAYVQAVRGTRVQILDTRKTLPGLRALEKYAVHAGGGCNHRMNLSDAILIKSNHLRAAYSVERIAYSKLIHEVIRKARRKAKGKFVEIEVAKWGEFEAAVEAKPDVILLDNWSLSKIRRAAALLHAKRYPLHAKPLLEVSGGVTLANVRAIAKSGVDRISIGRLTHSAPSLDVTLRVVSNDE